jgi:hypothetical protein
MTAELIGQPASQNTREFELLIMVHSDQRDDWWATTVLMSKHGLSESGEHKAQAADDSKLPVWQNDTPAQSYANMEKQRLKQAKTKSNALDTADVVKDGPLALSQPLHHLSRREGLTKGIDSRFVEQLQAMC